MYAHMMITPVGNVNYKANKLKNDNKVFRVGFDWEDDITVYNIEDKEVRDIKVKNVSLYDDRIIFNGKKHHILNMLSK